MNRYTIESNRSAWASFSLIFLRYDPFKSFKKLKYASSHSLLMNRSYHFSISVPPGRLSPPFDHNLEAKKYMKTESRQAAVKNSPDRKPGLLDDGKKLAEVAKPITTVEEAVTSVPLRLIASVLSTTFWLFSFNRSNIDIC